MSDKGEKRMSEDYQKITIPEYIEYRNLKKENARLRDQLHGAVEVIEFYENSCSYSHGGSDFLGDNPSSNRAKEFLAGEKISGLENTRG